jgi:amino acid transporter
MTDFKRIDDLEGGNESEIESMGTGNPLQQFLKLLPQVLRKGGTPTALILALGTIAIPLALLQSNLIVAGILAGGAVLVALICAIGFIFQRNMP